MPEFFFHFLDGDTRDDDLIGMEFASAEHAYLEAVAGARGLWTDMLADGRAPSRCAFEIGDSHGAILFHIDFAEAMKADERSRPMAPSGAFRLQNFIDCRATRPTSRQRCVPAR